MEINLPFRLKDIYRYRNLKTENNRINLEIKKKKIFRNIKTIWDKEPNLIDSKNSPIKMKYIRKPLSIINSNLKNKNLKSLSIDNSESNIHINRGIKLSKFENINFHENVKNKFAFSLNKSINDKNKGEIKQKNNYTFKIINSDNKNILNKNINSRNENEKAHIINLPEVRKKNMSPNSFFDANSFFINLNKCLENFVNKYNKDAVEEFIKKQKKIYFNSVIKNNLKLSKNNSKIEKPGKNISYNNNKGAFSLQKMLLIEPIKTKINGNKQEINASYEKALTKTNSKFNQTIKEESPNKQKKSVVLPNLARQDTQNSEEKPNNLYRKTFNIPNNKRVIKTDNNISISTNNRNNLIKNKIVKGLHTVSSNPNFTKSQSQFASPKNKEEKLIKNYKIEINNKIKSLLYDIPPPNFYSKDFYYYNIYPKNCGWLIKKCFEHRTKWKECHSNNTNLFDFKWKDVTTAKDFIDFGTSKKQLINHYENHSCLSNKYKMFYNFAKFCESSGIDVFKYVPFTICFDYLNYDELIIYQEHFKEIFRNIDNYIFENDSINNQLYDRKKIPYKRLFPLADPKMGNKFYCEIPKSHYAGKNLWIVKAPNLNRGRCIKIFDNYNEILKFLNEIKKGNVYQYDNIKEKGCKSEEKDKKEQNTNILEKFGQKDIKTELNNNNLEKIEEKEEIKEEEKIKEENKSKKNNKNNIVEKEKINVGKEKKDIEKVKNNTEKEENNTEKEKTNLENSKNISIKEKNNIEKEKNIIVKEKTNVEKEKDNVENSKNIIIKEKNNVEKEKNITGKEKNNTRKEKNNTENEKNKDKREKGDYQSDIIIIQKYIEKPFLYNGRKCDIRIWVLISHKMDVYIFKEGHLKASSVNYNINNNNSFIHLTNYSLQKYNENFSKYETGNEISFEIFQQYLNTLGDKSFNFKEIIIPKFKNIIELTTKSSKNLINQKNKNHCFEIFGYDFMMDEDKNIYLIEINTNPGLEISSEIIEILVPRMIDDALRITVDELFKTEYSKEWIGEDDNYKSNYHVDGYDDNENMWEFICNINKSNDKYICEDYYGFGYHKNISKKKRKKSKGEK